MIVENATLVRAHCDIEVIIPTLADTQRKSALLRAIDSVVSQEGIAARPLVIINGERFDPDLRKTLERRSDLSVHYEPLGSLPRAIEVGRKKVTAPYFSFLDDDDEYLPMTLTRRVKPLMADASLAVVVSNGEIKKTTGESRVMVQDQFGLDHDPLAALMQSNWLASCGGTFRTCAIEASIFEQIPHYHEWTYVAFQLVLRQKRLLFLPDIVFRIHETQGSLSKSEPYIRSAPTVHRQLLNKDLPKHLKKRLREKLSRSLHCVADLDLRQGNKRTALRHHLASMASPYGLARYILYTRKFIWPGSAN